MSARSSHVLLGLALLAPAPLSAQGLRSGALLVANQQSASASLIDLRTDSMSFIPVGMGPHEAMISPSGRTGVVTIYGTQVPGNELAVIDMKTGAVTRTISLGQYTRPHGVMFFPRDEDRVVVTSEATKNLVLVNVATGVVEGAIPTEALGSHMVAITGDGKRAFTSNIGSGSVSELDLEARRFVRSIPVAPRVEGIAVTPDGRFVFAGSNTSGTVSVIDTRSGTVIDTLTGFRLPYRLAVSPDGSTAIACDPEGDAIHVIDVASRTSWKIDALPAPRGVIFTSDGKTAFVTLAGGPSVGVVDLAARKVTRTIGVGNSPDGVGYGPNP